MLRIKQAGTQGSHPTLIEYPKTLSRILTCSQGGLKDDVGSQR